MLNDLKKELNMTALQILGWGNLIGLLLWWVSAPIVTIVYYILFKDDLTDKELAQVKKLGNFYLSATIYSIIAFVLAFAVVGFVLLPLVGLWSLIYSIVAIVKLIGDKEFEIPFVISLIE